MTDWLNPSQIYIDGRFESGLSVCLEGATIETRPQTAAPEPWILSPSFVNAHSHLEYRGLMGAIHETEFMPWIRAISMLKSTQNPSDILADCHLAARENWETGVSEIWEHSDRIGARSAMTAQSLQGPVFQEVITFNEPESPDEKLAMILEKASDQGAGLSPHAPYTVDAKTLRWLADHGHPQSIHLAESPAEDEFYRFGSGPMKDMYDRFGVEPPEFCGSPTQYLDSLGWLKVGRQVVHVCTVDDQDIELLARRGVMAAHCPRSNEALGCPVSPVRRLLEAGIEVGIGLDSAASSGSVDMILEIRAAILASIRLGEPLAPETAWSLAAKGKGWIRIDAPGFAAAIQEGSREQVSWIHHPASAI